MSKDEGALTGPAPKSGVSPAGADELPELRAPSWNIPPHGRSEGDGFTTDPGKKVLAPEPEARAHLGSITVPILLFVLTIASTIFVGGIAFSATLMTILVAHEAGHYVMARRHGVPASLPYFIPLPVSIIGTFGAVIGMRSDQATRNQLMDIGAAGPICGFIVAIPAMLIGVLLSTPVQLEPGQGIMLGDSILSYALTKLFGPELPPGWDLQAHPVMVAAWAGFLVTGLNLLPVGQLDGGHVLYALNPDRSAVIMRRVHRVLIALGIIGVLVQGPSIVWQIVGPDRAKEYFSLELLEQTRPLFRFFTPGFLFIAILTHFIGIKHPPVRDADSPLTPVRRATAIACVAIFLLAFMPNPAWQDAPWLTPEETPTTEKSG